MDSQEKISLKLEVVEKVSSLAAAGFGLVAALAWNDAIQSLFAALFPAQDGVWAKFAYALFITIIVVIASVRMGALVQSLKARLK